MGVGGAAGADVIHKENEDGEMDAIKKDWERGVEVTVIRIEETKRKVERALVTQKMCCVFYDRR
ncbi:MAG: hypothetical protein ACXU9K_04475 [Thermodesulfobacteriota bacterium]